MGISVIALLASFAGYALFGWWGLTLAIPPGFASAVWPAAGVALACTLLFSSRLVYLGIGLGSFVVNLSVTSSGWVDISLTNILPAASIAIGAILQAVFGHNLFIKFVGKLKILSITNNLLGLAFITAPLGCCIAATTGTLTLFIKGFVPLDGVLFTWMTWWAGDTIGVLLFTPLVLALFSPDSSLSFLRKLQITIPTLVIFLGVWTFFLISLENNHKEQQAKFNDISDGFSRIVERRVRISENELNAYKAFYRSSQSVSREEFEQFSSIMLGNDNVFQAVSWTEIIPHKNRALIEKSFRDEGYVEFEFTEISEDGGLVRSKNYDEYFPVLFLYPYEENRKALGLNLGANKERKATLMLAKSIRKPVATPPIKLVQEDENVMGIILYTPIFNSNEEGGDFMGYIAGVIRIKGILGDVIDSAHKNNISMSVMDVTDKENHVVIFQSDENTSNKFAGKQYQLKLGTRDYILKLSANSHFMGFKKDWTSWMVLTAGFFLTATMFIFLLNIVNTIYVVDRRVEIKTKELNEALIKADQANKAKSIFLANINHELRTPLNAIIGFIRLAKKEYNDKKRNSFLMDAALASDTLLGLINQSLEYAKIESGKLELDLNETSIIEKLIKIKTIFGQQINEKGLDFNIKIDGKIPEKVIADSIRFEQILLNLMSNAIKFTESGYISITISFEIKDAQSKIRIVVEDTGIGISSNNQAVFEAFKQEDSSTSRRYGGTGLGLSISRELAQLMGGGVVLDSSYSSGCRFIVTLNLELCEGTAYFDAKDFYQGSKDVSFNDKIDYSSDCLNNIRLLLVEDVLMNQVVAQELLEGFGAEIIIADNGQIALEILERDQNFDLVLMDLQMPVMDGYTATKAIVANPHINHIPVMAMTANAMDADIEKCLEVGMVGHISKPIEESVLIKKILKYVA